MGKTTTVANLAVGSAKQGNKTLVVDMDPQADVTYALLGQRAPEAKTGYVPPSTFAMLTDHYPIEKVILDVPKQRFCFGPRAMAHPTLCTQAACGLWAMPRPWPNM